MRRAWFFAQRKPSGSEPGAARAEGIAQIILQIKKNAIGIRRVQFAIGNREYRERSSPGRRHRPNYILHVNFIWALPLCGRRLAGFTFRFFNLRLKERYAPTAG